MVSNIITASHAKFIIQQVHTLDREKRIERFESQHPDIVGWLEASILDLANKGFSGVELSLKQYVQYRTIIMTYLRDCDYEVNNLDNKTISIRWG